MTDSVLLRASNITKSYAGVQALKQASFELRAGEVHAIVGENGAGKSTLIKMLSGVLQPDEGRILVNGSPVALRTPQIAQARCGSAPRRELCFVARMARPMSGMRKTGWPARKYEACSRPARETCGSAEKCRTRCNVYTTDI